MRFSLISTEKLQKDLEQGNGGHLVSRQIPLVPEMNGLEERQRGEGRAPAKWSFLGSRERGQGLGSAWRSWTWQGVGRFEAGGLAGLSEPLSSVPTP